MSQVRYSFDDFFLFPSYSFLQHWMRYLLFLVFFIISSVLYIVLLALPVDPPVGSAQRRSGAAQGHQRPRRTLVLPLTAIRFPCCVVYKSTYH
jgi:hypothetical protein